MAGARDTTRFSLVQESEGNMRLLQAEQELWERHRDGPWVRCGELTGLRPVAWDPGCFLPAVMPVVQSTSIGVFAATCPRG